MAWQDDALCAQTDPEVFFPEKGISTAPAKGVCLACSCRAACLEFALEHGEDHGVWGGLDARQRQAIRRNRAALRVAS
ncbi:WhiB family transcriptional regulator [Streptomyces thermolilacinus]|uniref:WhiB family transcriptional regulator n=1 Tax=Streptomyces thermolilacinus TaxID=285540 RepID=UPI0033FECE8E